MSKVALFAQIISKLNRLDFNKIVREKESDKHCKGYTSWTHLVSMLFCSRCFGTKSQSEILAMDFDLPPEI